jgi:hypothetical protein
VAQRRFLDGWSVAVSISGSPDLAQLGLGEAHLADVMAEVARHLMAAGAHLVYGGDLRAGGFTVLLFEVASRHAITRPNGPRAFTNLLPWPAHVSLSPGDLAALRDSLGEYAAVERLDVSGNDVPPDATFAGTQIGPGDWRDGLTAMRRRVAKQAQARIVVGGVVEGYKGRMPGIAEEVALSFEARQPVFLVGGFGGCARDIAADLGLLPSGPRRAWSARRIFAARTVDDLGNRLTCAENERLARSCHTDEIVALVLRGLRRLRAAAP